MTISDEKYMDMAIREAKAAMAAGEIPIGAIITAPDGTVIGRGHNLTESLGDVKAHAEMQAITAAAATLGGKYLQGCTLYVTVEPCLMCAGAIGWSQISRIVYGCRDEKRGYSTITSQTPFHPRATVACGVRQDECASLIQKFFKDKR